MIDQTMKAQIDRLFQEYDTGTSPGCALGILQEGELLYGRGYGLANLEAQIPISTDTVFHLASVSKQFTATCVALLEEAGEIDLEDEAKRYLAFLPDCGMPLKVRHLLHMTNGLEDFYEVTSFIMGIPEGEYFSREDAIRIIQAAGWRKFPPGEKWAYGNTGYFLLACIIETVTGKPFAEFVAEQIFRPLGMHSTFVRTDRFAEIPNRASGYDRLVGTTDTTYRLRNEMIEFGGAGQAWSTVNDLVKWENNFLDNRLGKRDPGLIEKLFEPGRLNDGTPTRYAYGQFISERAGCRVVFHEGGAAGVNTVLYRIPAKGLSVICLANTGDFLTSMLRKLGEECYERVAGIISPWEPTSAAAGPEQKLQAAPREAPQTRQPLKQLERIVGSYEDPGTSHIWEVSVDDTGIRVLENYSSGFSLLVTGPAGTDRLSFQCKETGLHGAFCRLIGSRFMEIRVGEEPSLRAFQRYLGLPLAPDALQEYPGIYTCRPLGTSYRVHATVDGICLENLDPDHDFLNVVFTPTIRDMFLARYPPLIGWYVIQFRRDAAGEVAAFVFRDEAPGRDHWVFTRE